MNRTRTLFICFLIITLGAVMLFFILTEKVRRAIDRIINGRDV
jgi:CHASE3 domain sensor protein